MGIKNKKTTSKDQTQILGQVDLDFHLIIFLL